MGTAKVLLLFCGRSARPAPGSAVALHEARREVLLYLILLEPGLAPAIKTAKALSQADGP